MPRDAVPAGSTVASMPEPASICRRLSELSGAPRAHNPCPERGAWFAGQRDPAAQSLRQADRGVVRRRRAVGEWGGRAPRGFRCEWTCPVGLHRKRRGVTPRRPPNFSVGLVGRLVGLVGWRPAMSPPSAATSRIVARPHPAPAIYRWTGCAPAEVASVPHPRDQANEQITGVTGGGSEPRGHPHPEPGGQPGVGVRAAQVRQHQQRLLPGRQLPPPRPDYPPVRGYPPGHEDQGLAGQVDRRRVHQHAKLLGLDAVDLGRTTRLPGASPPARTPRRASQQPKIRLERAHWNTSPKPFTWTATADEILAKVRIVQTNIKKLVNHNAK